MDFQEGEHTCRTSQTEEWSLQTVTVLVSNTWLVLRILNFVDQTVCCLRLTLCPGFPPALARHGRGPSFPPVFHPLATAHPPPCCGRHRGSPGQGYRWCCCTEHPCPCLILHLHPLPAVFLGWISCMWFKVEDQNFTASPGLGGHVAQRPHLHCHTVFVRSHTSIWGSLGACLYSPP